MGLPCRHIFAARHHDGCFCLPDYAERWKRDADCSRHTGSSGELLQLENVDVLESSRIASNIGIQSLSVQTFADRREDLQSFTRELLRYGVVDDDVHEFARASVAVCLETIKLMVAQKSSNSKKKASDEESMTLLNPLVLSMDRSRKRIKSGIEKKRHQKKSK